MNLKQFGNKNITNITHLANNTQWKVYHTCAVNKIITTSDGLDWWVNSYVIYMQRETAYYTYNLLLPCFILSILSMLLFQLPPDSGKFFTKNIINKNSSTFLFLFNLKVKKSRWVSLKVIKD